MNKYNKYHESLVIDCCKDKLPKPPKSKSKCECCCDGMHLHSHDNEIETLIRQLKKEVCELMKSTEARLLCQNKKIDETMVYVKNNLSNALRKLLNAMLDSGQLEDLITGVVANEIEVIESDVERLKTDLTQTKANVQLNTSDITNLKGAKTGFEEYEDTSIIKTFQNVEIAHDYFGDSLIYITKIKNVEKLSVLPSNGDPSANVDDNKRNVVDYSKTNNNYDIYMNAGFKGIYIFDGIVNETSRLDVPYYCGFTKDNQMKFYDAFNNTITATDLVNDGIVNCFSGTSPIIVNGNPYDYTPITSQYGQSSIATTFVDYIMVKHPRQLIANDVDGNFYIISVYGRTTYSTGLSYDEMIAYFTGKGYLNVFNCDGGGSTQTVVNKNDIIYPSLELDTNIDRKIPSIIGFKVKELK